MSRYFSLEYEFSDNLAARIASNLVNKKQKELAAKFWSALRVQLLYTIISGLILLSAHLLETPFWLMLIPWSLVAFFGGLLTLLLVLHCVALMFEAVAHWRVRRQLVAPFSQVWDRSVRWIFRDDNFEVHSAISDRIVSWNDLSRFQSDPDFWILGVKDGPDLLLPVESLSAEAQELIRHKAGSYVADQANPIDLKKPR